MKTFVTAMALAEADRTKLGKQEALSQLSADGQRMMIEMLSPFRVFGIKKFDMPRHHDETDAPAGEFFALLDKLHARQLTGNAAKAALTSMLSKYTADTALYLIRVIGKDPKAGFSESTVNKVFPKLVPTWTAMKGVKVDAKYVFVLPIGADLKYDGERCIAFSGNPVQYFAFSGKPQEHLYGVFDDEINALATELGYPITLDGEVLGESFQGTTRSKKGGADGDAYRAKLKIVAFDIMKQEEWYSENCVMVQKDRDRMVAEVLAKTGVQRIVKSEGVVCHTKDELVEYYEKAVERGLEGLMLKKQNGIYEWKRSQYWAKWKPVQDFDLKIVGFIEGTKGTKNEGSLGALMLEGHDENGNLIKTDCGGIKVRSKKFLAFLEELGINQKTANIDRLVRDEIFNNQAKYLGATVMIEGQELTLAEGASHYSVRFPQLICVRTDKTAE